MLTSGIFSSSEKASKPDTTQFIASIDELGASVKAGVYICETPKCLGRDVLEAGKRAYPNVTFMTMTKGQLKTATSENIFMPEVVEPESRAGVTTKKGQFDAVCFVVLRNAECYFQRPNGLIQQVQQR